MKNENVGATLAVAHKEADETKKKPSLKKGSILGFSISQSAQQALNKANEQALTKKEVPQPAKTSETNSSIDQKQLELCWREFASALPKEETANSKRMMNMQPVVTDPKGSFEVTVENDNVRSNILRLQDQIVRYLGEKLHNKQLLMSIRVMEATENTRAYSPAERFKIMAAKNPKLLTLQEELGLELC